MSSKLIFLFVFAAINLEGFVFSLEDFRLPRTVIPYHYKIQILTDLANDFSYEGKVLIDIKATQNTDEVTLHSKNLDIFKNETRIKELKDSFVEFNDANIVRRLKRNSAKFKMGENYAFNYTKPQTNRQDEAQDIITFPKNDEEPLKKNPIDKLDYEISTFKIKDSPSATMQSPITHSESPESPSRSTASSSTEFFKGTSKEIYAGVDNHSLSETNPEDSFVNEPVTFTSVLTNKNSPSISPETTTKAMTLPEFSVPPAHQTHQVDEDLPHAKEKYSIEEQEFDLENDFLTIRLNKPLVQGKLYRLQFKYRGVLTDTLTGFHRVPYVKRASQKSTWLASTVFEPSEARTAFPCFDEPDFKSTFDIILGHEKKYTALSNMPLKETAPVAEKPEWQWSTFETTPRMPTYLVAFLISDLEYLTPRTNATYPGRNITYRFWSRHDVLYKTRYAMRIAPEMKNYLENLFQVQDVLPKHDFIALPSFVSTALENWGLYSFAEKNLLFTSGFSSIFSKFQITQVLAHEISHMWFGNMVTPKWWDQIWLSEGFSNFFEIVAADHVQPQWDLKTTSVIFAYLKVFSLDALHSSHPLVPEFDEPKDLNEIFDSISYQKGFYLVRMLNYTLGEEAFMDGVRKYLKTHHLSNVDEDDLWEAFNDLAHQEANLAPELHLKDIMSNWTRKAGYPILQVTRDYEHNTAVVTQKRFLRFKGDNEFRQNLQEYDDENTKWWIPLTYTTGSDVNFRETKPKIWLNPAEESVTLTDMPSKNDFVLMNLDAAGLYRVNYDERNWALLISYLINEDYSEISILNRVQILDDLLDLARSGDVSYETALEATAYLKKERHFLPWKAALSNFDFISRMFRSRDGGRTLKKFLRHLIIPRFEELGFEAVKNESFSDSLNRKQIATWACRTGLRQCTRKSISLFKRWMQEKRPDEYNPIPNSLRSAVYCSAIENGGSKEWQFLWQRYLNNVLADQAAILNGLGCTKNTRTLKRYLDWSLKETSGIRKQDVPIIFKAVARNDAGFYLAKNFMKERLNDMRRYLGNNPFFLPQMIDALAGKMNHPNDLLDLEDMEQANSGSYRSASRSFRQAFERVKFNMDWTEKNYHVITDWLKRKKF